jgi:hypothetical protein
MKVQSAVVLALAAVGFACPASADVVPVPEFVGDLSEGMEGVAPPGGQPGPVTIFGGAATVDDSLAHFIVITFTWTGWGPDEQIGTKDDVVVEPHNGNLFGGAVAGSVVYAFNPPVAQFGGYFTTVGNASGGTAVFRDDAGAQIGSLPMTIVPGEWIWQGWSSDVPIATVEITTNNPPGQFSAQFDDMTLSYPETGCAADTDGSGAVDVDDLVAVILGWGECPAKGGCPADVDDSGAVDVDDLVAVILAWGDCP